MIIHTRGERRTKAWQIPLGLFVLLCAGLLDPAAKAGDSPFPADVVCEGGNPDFILNDTNGQNWALESGEPVPNAFAISHGAGGDVHALVIEDGAPQHSLYVRANGQVGLGTIAPLGDLTIFDPDNSGDSSIRFFETSGASQDWKIEVGSFFGGSFRIHNATTLRDPFLITDDANSFLHLQSGFVVLHSGPTIGGKLTLDGLGAATLAAGTNSSLTLDSAGATLSGALVELSSREQKAAVRQVEPRWVLDKVLELPIAEWKYATDKKGVRHLGPMAEDFHSAFGLGPDDKGISTLDTSGVALAAIQGLNLEFVEHDKRFARLAEEAEEKDREIGELRDEIARLRRLVEESR